jgi:hypothetical protein
MRTTFRGPTKMMMRPLPHLIVAMVASACFGSTATPLAEFEKQLKAIRSATEIDSGAVAALSRSIAATQKSLIGATTVAQKNLQTRLHSLAAQLKLLEAIGGLKPQIDQAKKGRDTAKDSEIRLAYIAFLNGLLKLRSLNFELHDLMGEIGQYNRQLYDFAQEAIRNKETLRKATAQLRQARSAVNITRSSVRAQHVALETMKRRLMTNCCGQNPHHNATLKAQVTRSALEAHRASQQAAFRRHRSVVAAQAALNQSTKVLGEADPQSSPAGLARLRAAVANDGLSLRQAIETLLETDATYVQLKQAHADAASLLQTEKANCLAAIATNPDVQKATTRVEGAKLLLARMETHAKEMAAKEKSARLSLAAAVYSYKRVNVAIARLEKRRHRVRRDLDVARRTYSGTPVVIRTPRRRSR